MTEQQPEPEVVEAEAQDEQQAEEQQPEPDATEEESERVRALSVESKTYRQKASAARKEADAMRTVAEAYVRQAAERLIGNRLSRPGLVWELGGMSPLDLLTEDATIDTERLDAAVEVVVTKVPEARPPIHHGDLGVKKSTTPPARGFGDVLAQRRR